MSISPESMARREARILSELQDAVTRMHVLSGEPRVVYAACGRAGGPRPMAWQVLFERSFGSSLRELRYRGASAASLSVILARGFDDEPTLSRDWSHSRLDAAMLQGPVIQAFRADRLPDDVENALVGLLVFAEDGLHIDGVRSLLGLLKEP
jgi:hypothetical protein